MANAAGEESPGSWEQRQLCFGEPPKRSELSGQRNKAEVTRNKITQQKDILSRGILGLVRGVRYGTFDGKRAVMLLLQFIFDFDRNIFRFKSVSVNIAFQKYTRQGSQAHDGLKPPALIYYSPGHIFGDTTSEEKEIKYEIAAQFSATVGPLSIGPEFSASNTSTFSREHALEISGIPLCDEDADEPNRVKFSIEENKKADHGIPNIIHLGMVVQCDGDLQSLVKVDVDSFPSWPWHKDDPLLLLSPFEKGPKPRTTEFDQLTAEDWKSLVPYEDEGVNVHGRSI